MTGHGGGRPISAEDAQAFVTLFDANGDGVLDFGEFCTAMGSLMDGTAGTAEKN